jgi:hypothetical protein
MQSKRLLLCAVIAVAPFTARGQQPAEGDSTQPKHVLWIIPNYRTSSPLDEYKPISNRAKLEIAKQDTFDRGTIALAAAFAGMNQIDNSDRTFGQGTRAYSRYLATSYTDFGIGNYMTEGAFPILLHQDPRYFRKGSGSKLARLGYAVSQVLFTHGDGGKTEINYSELLGNSTAVAISQAYYPEGRNATDAGVSLGIQIAVDAAANVLKEFWPNRQRHEQ